MGLHIKDYNSRVLIAIRHSNVYSDRPDKNVGAKTEMRQLEIHNLPFNAFTDEDAYSNRRRHIPLGDLVHFCDLNCNSDRCCPLAPCDNKVNVSNSINIAIYNT